MANIPSREKFRKQFKMLTNKLPMATRNVEFAFGDFGLIALESGRITEKQIEALRKAVVRGLQRKGQVFKKIFPHTPFTKKPIAVRMGKGKGPVEGHGSPILKGELIIEIDGVDEPTAFNALELGKYKLGFKTKIVKRY
jgi:large subunit ribosomal protein L16